MHEPIAVVARALDNPLLHDLLERVRTSTGNTVIYRRGGLRRILRALQQNAGVALLIDQHIQAADAVLVDFFGRPASTTSAVAALAYRTGAAGHPRVRAAAARTGATAWCTSTPIDPPRDDSPEAVREFTQRCTDVLEMYVRRHPDLWLWMHKRWRDDEAPGPGCSLARGMGQRSRKTTRAASRRPRLSSLQPSAFSLQPSAIDPPPCARASEHSRGRASVRRRNCAERADNRAGTLRRSPTEPGRRGFPRAEPFAGPSGLRPC